MGQLTILGETGARPKTESRWFRKSPGILWRVSRLVLIGGTMLALGIVTVLAAIAVLMRLAERYQAPY
jgi:hypothetical protein